MIAVHHDSKTYELRFHPCDRGPVDQHATFFFLFLEFAPKPTRAGTSNNKIASRCGAPRPPMTDVGTEAAFFQLTTPVAME